MTTSYIDPISRQLQALHRELAPLDTGDLADYIPELARADRSLFGLALVSMGGAVYAAGDADMPFTIQSVSKPFVYAMALADRGLDAVMERVGVEPSGEAFNAISLEAGTGRPANPMINAGAILATALVEAGSPAARFERIRLTLSTFAGRELGIDEAVYASERETGDRNRALGYLMRNAGALRADVEETTDVYFRQCALLVTAVDVATMAATLANRGVNPVTGVPVVSSKVAGQVLTVMATCGMYDYSGSWLMRVGLPAKSGVSGGVVAASPGEFGIGLFSPPVDELGNSVRAVAACKALASRFDLHLLVRPGRAAPLEVEPEHDVPAPDGVVTRRLRGDLTFADGEMLLRSLRPLLDGSAATALTTVSLDVREVDGMCRSAGAMLVALVQDLAARGHTVEMIDRPGRSLIATPAIDPTAVERPPPTDTPPDLHSVPDTSLAEGDSP